MRKTKKNKVNRKNKLFFVIKFLLVFLALLIFFSKFEEYKNQINLLAVIPNSNGEIIDSSLIGLELKVKKGVGEIFFNSNSLIDTDTQLSIINSQKITCETFNLECDNYNFYYNFKGNNLILKGPSASTSISNLVLKTIEKQKIRKDVVFTGNLLFGGLVSAVGGVDEKIELSQKNNFSKIYIPYSNSYNTSKNYSIEIIKIFNIEELKENTNFKTFSKTQNENFDLRISDLTNSLCDREDEIFNGVSFENLSEFENNSYNTYKRSKNFSNQNIHNYSKGSFCFSKNINLRFLYEFQNYNESDFILKVQNLKNEINEKLESITDENYIKNIKSKNNLDVYLLLNDRLNEAYNLIDKIDIESNDTYSKVYEYSFGFERFYTSVLWEKLMKNITNEMTLNLDNLEVLNVCEKVISQIRLKSEVSPSEIKSFFLEELYKVEKLKNENPYLCVYEGIEANSRFDMSLNILELDENETKKYAKKLNDMSKNLLLKISDDSSIIPYIYVKYSEDLFNLGSIQESIYYSNLAISFLQMDLFFEKKEIKKSEIINLLENNVFLISLLLLLIF